MIGYNFLMKVNFFQYFAWTKNARLAGKESQGCHLNATIVTFA